MADLSANWQLKWDLLVADAWADDALMKRLKADPAAVLKERGIAVPPGTTVNLLEDSDKAWNMVVPTKPPAQDLSSEQLDAVAGGAGGGSVYIPPPRRCRGSGS